MFEEIVRILKENYGIENVKPESNFKKDLGLSSFDLMELAFVAEDRFGLEIEECSYRSMETVKDISDYFEALKVKANENQSL
ncbi:MAG: acyl carrier protein [Lachnospiraceae bacterium]|nr:acyl carrier protein [Lachnospiraceae bacterium]